MTVLGALSTFRKRREMGPHKRSVAIQWSSSRIVGMTVRTNRRAYVLPRQLAMYIVRQPTRASLQEIGREFGGKHHATVLHSINTIEDDVPR